jgi:hypothetical protein
MKKLFPRRTFLRGVGGAGVALPLMSSLSSCTSTDIGSARRGLSEFPLRFIVWYIPNGNLGRELPPAWDFTGSVMEPLVPFQSKLLLLTGLDMTVHNQGPGEPHQQGMAWLTGRRLNPGVMVGGDGTLAGWASGISVDQRIAEVIGTTTPKRSLHFGVQSTNYGGTEVRTVMSYLGSDQPLANETSPWAMFDASFSELGADPAVLAARRMRRRSILDLVGRQYEGVIPKLATDDKRKLEQHLTAIRDIEMRLDNPAAELGASCMVPDVGAEIGGASDPANYPIVGRLQMDLLAMALACDVTRVATIQWSASTNNRPYPFLNYDEGLGAGPQPIVGDEHILGHEPDDNVSAWGKLRVIRRWYMEQLAYLLAKLDAIPEGDGTMLDNTVLLLGSEVSAGNSHSHMDNPFLIAGSGAGHFAMNRRLDFGGDVSHNNLLVSLLQSMGLPDETFGEPEFCTGPLSGLTT